MHIVGFASILFIASATGRSVIPQEDTVDFGSVEKRDSNLVPKCSYRIYTLTDNGANSKTDDPISIRFHIGSTISGWYSINDPNINDREKQHWDRYFRPNLGPGHLTGVTLRNLGTDGWQIENIYIKNNCTGRVYEFDCNSCWVDSPTVTYKYIPRSSTV